MEDEDWPALVPEMICADLTESLAFYRDRLGFTVRFGREGFAYLTLGRVHLMLEQMAPDLWITAPLERPYGRGINFQIEVPDLAAIQTRLEGMALFREPQETWYRAGDVLNGQRELLVQDPDGYLLRFAEWLGERPAA